MAIDVLVIGVDEVDGQSVIADLAGWTPFISSAWMLAGPWARWRERFADVTERVVGWRLGADVSVRAISGAFARAAALAATHEKERCSRADDDE